MLELRNVRKTYTTKAGEVNALDGVSLTFPSAGLVFISGKSGCGKTTLLNVIGGLDGIDGGEIYMQDKGFSSFSAQEYDSYRNTVVGFVFQEYNLLAEYTVEYNIKIAMELQGQPVDEEAFEKLLRDVEIADLRNRKPSELSGGQRQRVAIARALVKQPRIIMADEPTGALDSATGAQVLDLLKKLSKDKLVIVVSHDGDFAEKYADRIVHLVDGKVVDDITFTEQEIHANVSEQNDAVVVKEGAELSPQETAVLVKAVKERKKIEMTEKLCFRRQAATGEVVKEALEPIAFKKSKMKLKSSAYLGMKSLVVKPVRLAITVLISALAFAVFGLFDTVATFNTKKILRNSLGETSKTMVATADYIVDYNADDKYDLKVSDETLAALAQETGGVVKGIYDFRDNTSGSVSCTQPISELSSSGVVVGKRYYANVMNGFIEFDEQTEINADGSFKDFDYTLVSGAYPTLRYVDGVLDEASLYEVAISTYLADSVLYYLNGSPLGEKEVTKREDLLDCTLTVKQVGYKIVGIIDCGQIPEKYEEIKASTPYNAKLNALLDDYDSFINAGAQKCFFVANGFRKTINEKTSSSAAVFYTGNTDWTVTLPTSTVKKKLTDYVYDATDYDEDNVVLFSGTYPENGAALLADDEILVHYLNLENVLSKEISLLPDEASKKDVRTLLRGLDGGGKNAARQKFQAALTLLGKQSMQPLTSTVDIRFTETGKKLSKEVKIVGFYFGVDPTSYTSSSQYKLMLNPALMREFSIYPEQGDYTQILFSSQSVKKGTNAIVEYLTNETGFALTWYSNSVLSLIKENEAMIQQAADLFLYAALALAAFSIFMLYNYVSTSIANKRRSVGVLRGLGAGGKDIFLTFLCESLVIGLICGVLANVLCAVGCTLVNSYIMNTMNISVAFALFEIRQVLIILGVSLLTAVLSSALPIIKISKKKPVELIRRP